uniref:Bromo domain-containing protein n=1 Tax=Parascaris equorum TaxID=6256 RepID=A0A914RS89_PAREQ
MNVDRSITFDKEMILFPMLYPDVFAQYNVVPPKGVLFYGPPGTGKTLMARALANACSSDLLCSRRLFKQAYDMRPAIIFFDEIDGLAPARTLLMDIASLQSLCVEAVIAALRARFPQIYVSDEKLMIDPTQVIVTNKHFFSAMQRIVPAACRESAVDMIIQDRIPVGYHKRIAQEGEGCSELEKVLRELKVPNAVPSVRLLLHARCSDYGQTSYVLPFIVNRNPEDSFSQIVQSALRTASSGTPCILLIPSIDEWQQAVPPSVWHRVYFAAPYGAHLIAERLQLMGALDGFAALTPILLLATANCHYTALPPDITAPCKAAVESYFRFIIVRGGTRRIEKFIDRRFQPFARPVDSRVVPDYYVHITNPMDLSTMYRKVESYKSPQEMLHDFNLIYSNAIEYNSDQDDEGQHIRFLAKLLLDMGKEIVYGLDPKLLKNMEEIKKSLSEVGIDPDATDLENGTPPVCNNTWQKNSYVPHAEDTQNEKITSSRKPPKKRRIFGSSYSRTKRAHLAAKRLRNCEASPSTSPSSVVNGRTDADDSDNESRSSLNEKSLDRMQKQEGEMERQAICPEVGGDVKALESVVDKAVAKTNGWPVVELERIGAELLQTIHLYHSGGCWFASAVVLALLVARSSNLWPPILIWGKKILHFEVNVEMHGKIGPEADRDPAHAYTYSWHAVQTSDRNIIDNGFSLQKFRVTAVKLRLMAPPMPNDDTLYLKSCLRWSLDVCLLPFTCILVFAPDWLGSSKCA